MKKIALLEAAAFLEAGQILAYPTEAVYGLGCDPFNERAVQTLLALKGRPASKGLIVLISDESQLQSLIQPIEVSLMEKVRKSWPGPYTWLFPKAPGVPDWLSGEHETLAIRMTAHPIARGLCQLGPIVSTSANKAGLEPARTENELNQQFPIGIDALVLGPLGNAENPSFIFDVMSGIQLR